MAKPTLKKKLEVATTTDFWELQATFHCVSAILNQRPLAATKLAGDLQAVSSTMLLLGRAEGVRTSYPNILPLPKFEAPKSRAGYRLYVVQQTVNAFWEEYSCTAFVTE